MPPSEFIIKKRLEKAKLLLLTTNYPLSEIIQQTGFKTTPYFCRMFKKYTSFTPEQFRKNRG
jgi:YesN/AraC family two-component response regulator